MTRAVELAQVAANGVSEAFKNRIINGAMVIDQRNAGASVTVNSASQFFPVDRFAGIGQPTDGVFTLQQDSSAPVGFINSIKATVTTADTSLGTTQGYSIQHKIEGTNIADLGWGTANAKTVTLSFWVRSSLTGTFGGAFRNNAANRSYPFTYTISSANTWEQKSITIAGDTTGTWLTNNDIGINVVWAMGAGTDRSGTAGAWNSNNNISATGAVSVIGTLNATFYITGVQLEVGSTATSFDYRPYGTELALCQRYFETSYAAGTAVGTDTSGLSPNQTVVSNGNANGSTNCFSSSIMFKVTKRATPTITLYLSTGTSGQWQWSTSGVSSENVNTTATAQVHSLRPFTNSTTTARNEGGGHFTASAEL